MQIANLLLALSVLVLALPIAADAATLRLTSVADTSFRPGLLDDTAVVGETFVLELWANCADTNVNGAEATIVFDGTRLELLESSLATDSFPPGSPGINSREDRSVFGNVLMNTGHSVGTAADTARYAALTNADSTRANARLVRFTFQVRPTALTGLTAVTFRSTATETTALTAADTWATNVLSGIDTGLILLVPGADTHAVLTLVAPLAGEYFAIFNPLDQAIDLSRFHVSTDDSNYITTTLATPTVASNRFIARFPVGATLAAGDTLVVALSSTAFHAVHPGVEIDFEIDQDGTSGDSVPDMMLVATSGVRELGDTSGTLIFFHWDGMHDLVRDVDILAWGAGAIPNKTGKSIDGIDADAVASTYLNDSALMTRPAAPGAGQVLRRLAWLSGDTGTNEPRTGGNGLTGHDETSESSSISWAITSDSVPWHSMLIAHKRGDFAAATALQNETQVEALSFLVRGAFGRAENLTQLDVVNLGSADTANITTVSLWIDANADSIIGAGDSHVANLTAIGSRSWRHTGALALPAGAGHRFVLGFDVGATVETGETVQLAIARQAILTNVSDSGSFVALVNGAALTLALPMVRVETAATIAARTILRDSINVTVMAINVRGNGADTLTSFAVANGGQLDSADVAVRLWRDADASLAWSAGDAFLGTLAWSAVTSRWETTAMALPLAVSGETLIVTIDVATTAGVEGDSFLAWIPATSAKSTLAETGPIALVSNLQAMTLINPPGIANNVVIAAVYPDAVRDDGNGEWILLYNPTDTPRNLQNWTIRRTGSANQTLPDSMIAARGWFLITDAGFVKDNPAWPDGDVTRTLTISNTNDGISLFDSIGVVVDRFGFGAEAIDKEGATAVNPGTNLHDIYVRRPHPLATRTDILWGGRDEFGGAGYDSFENATDFIRLTGTDTHIWTLRNSTSPSETPARKTTVVRIAGPDLASETFTLSQTNRLLMRLYIQGETTAAGTLTDFRIEATDTLADTNFASIRLYRDNNANLLHDGGDSFVTGLAPVAGVAAWESRAINFGFNSLAGETFLVVANIADTVTDGETFQPRIALRTVGTAGADSGPSLVRTSAAVFTLRAISALVITKGPNIASETVVPTRDTLTVMAFNVRGAPAGDTLTVFSIANNGSLDTGDIAAVHLWQDADNDSTWSSGDTLVATLAASDSRTWGAGGLSTFLGAGANFVVTVDLGAAGHGETFRAIIRAATVDAALFETGPASNVLEPGVITVSAFIAVRVLLSEVNVATGTDYVELWVLDDGAGGAGVNIAGWFINEQPIGGTDRKIFGDTDNNGSVDTAVIVRTGDRIVIYDAAGVDSSVAVDGVINLFNSGLALTATNDEVMLVDPSNTVRDVVVWSNRDGAHTDAADLAALIAGGWWQGPAATENVGVTPRRDASFTAGYSIQRGGSQDRDTYLDWGEAPITPGAANSIESPCVAPPRITTLNLVDLPDDLGGTLRLTWLPDTSNADFIEYRIYLETYPLDSLLETNVRPRMTLTDSSLGAATISGLANGVMYYAVVTAADTWGLEFRFGLADTGPATPIRNVTGTPNLLFTEVWFAGTETEFIEIRVIDDGNPTGSLNLAGFRLTADDTVTADVLAFGSVTVADSDYIVLWNRPGVSETDSGGDGVVNIRGLTFSLAEGNENLFLLLPAGVGDTILDFVNWSTRDGSPTAAELRDINYAIVMGAWSNLSDSQNNARNPHFLRDFENFSSITRDRLFTDNHADTDWAIDFSPTPGALTSILEAPFAAPAAVTGVTAGDVPNDLGGWVRLTWNPSAAPDLLHYNIYRETVAIPASLYNTNLFPRETAPITETSRIVTGLVNGATYWFTVTAVDSWGMERKLGLTVATAVPVANVVGETLLITEVSFREDAAGVIGNDWIEILVQNDGNGGNGIDLTGWRLFISAGFGLTRTISGVTARTGDYLLIHGIAGTDETDSGGDGVINLYLGAGTAFTATDNSVTFYRSLGDTEDFVTWTQPSAPPVNTADSPIIAQAFATGHWTDFAPAGVGVEDGVNSDSVMVNWSIIRRPDTGDLNSKNDWTFDSSPTPGARNDAITRWWVSGSLDLETRANDGGVMVTATNGFETHVVFSDSVGAFAFQLPTGVWSITGETTNYLRRRITGVTVETAALVGRNLGVMRAGDANGDNQINIFDASITKFAIDFATGNPLADHVDPRGVINAVDLEAVRTNFGMRGD